jgi:serine/threonine protein phosphatase PrpC
MEITALALSDIGRVKTSNEDRFLVDDDLRLYLVADGMGGHAAGEVASATAVEVIQAHVENRKEVLKSFSETGKGRGEILQLLEDAVRHACRAIYNKAQSNPDQRGMGTTVSALVLTPTRGFIAHVGDSRVYVLRQGDVIQLTEDHSLISELVRRGKLTPAEAEKAAYKNAVTRAVGVYADVQVDTLDLELAAGDTFVICSDGLSGHLREARELADVVEAHGVKAAAKAFIDLANNRGGSDNITAVLARVNAQRGEMSAPDGADIAIKVNILKRMPVFQHLSYVELVEVLNVSDVRSFAVGDVLFEEGEPGEELFIVIEGQVSIQKAGLDLAQLGPGGHFGEMSIMDKGRRSARVVTQEPTKAIVVGRRPLFALMRRDKDIAVKLLWCFVQVLNQRLRATNADLLRAKGDESIVDELIALDSVD